MAYSFSTSGSTPLSAPQVGPSSLAALNPGGVTPQAKALYSAYPTSSPAPSTGGLNASQQQGLRGLGAVQAGTAPSISAYNASIAPITSGLLPKSQTVTQADGSSHTVAYQIPPTPPSGGTSPGAVTNGTTPDQLASQQGLVVSTPATSTTAAQYGTQGGNSTTQGDVGTLGQGPPTSIAANQTAPGLLGNLIGQSQGLYQTQAGMINPAIQKNLDLVNAATQEEEQLTSGAYAGTGADYSGRMAQLENIKQEAQSNINAASQNLSTFSGQAQTAIGEGLNLAGPTGYVTPPAGAVSANVLTGAQVSNPILAPVGTQAFYSPQPGGTPGQPPTAGQPTQYTVQSGDTFNSLATKFSAGSTTGGITAAALEAANPGVVPTDMQIGSKLTIPATQSNNPFTGGVAQGEAVAGANIVQMQQGLAKAQSFQQGLTQFLSDPANASINFSQIAPLNALQQWYQNGIVPQGNYQTFFNYLNEYTNALAPVLGIGGNPTNLRTEIAQSFVNPNASPATILQVIGNMNTAAQAALAKMAAAGQNPQGSITPPTGGATPQSGGGSTYTASDGNTYSATQNPDGTWTVK